MHGTVYAEFRRVLAGLDLTGPVLEVGATRCSRWTCCAGASAMA